MEVGRIGDLRIRDGSIVRLPLVGDRLYRWAEQKTFLRRKGWRLIAPPVGRRSHISAVRPKIPLTWGGLLMEVARDTPGAMERGRDQV